MKKLKNLFLMVLAVITIFGSTIGGLQIHGAETRDEQLDNLLAEYFSEREGEFYENEATTYNARSLNIELSAREKSLDEWREKLGIQVENVEITYIIKDILAETTSTMELLVYEWVEVEYICDGYDTLEDMGFGTDHILVFENNLGTWTLVEDAYSEITGYEDGSEEHLEQIALAREVEEEVAAEAYATEMTTSNARVAGNIYNAEAAVEYSYKWCGRISDGDSGAMVPSNYNPEYYYYVEADCCNFVSQCLYAGGTSMSGNWWATTNSSGIVTKDSPCEKSGIAWRKVPYFKTHFKELKLPIVEISSASQAVAGNPIFWLESDGEKTNHAMLIVGVNSAGRVLVNGHNPDMRNCPIDLSGHKYYTIDMKHTYKATSNSSTTHTCTCCTCGASFSASHSLTMTSNATHHWKKCTVCGYSALKLAHSYNSAGVCKICGWIKDMVPRTYTISNETHPCAEKST